MDGYWARTNDPQLQSSWSSAWRRNTCSFGSAFCRSVSGSLYWCRACRIAASIAMTIFGPRLWNPSSRLVSSTSTRGRKFSRGRLKGPGGRRRMVWHGQESVRDRVGWGGACRVGAAGRLLHAAAQGGGAGEDDPVRRRRCEQRGDRAAVGDGGGGSRSLAEAVLRGAAGGPG
jgi:hypothetical protein